MDKNEIIVKNIQSYIANIMKGSLDVKRGKMYGSIEQLESIWIVLNRIDLIINGLENNLNNIDFTAYLIDKGFGAKSASSIIKEMNTNDSYRELIKIWTEYISWKNTKINEINK